MAHEPRRDASSRLALYRCGHGLDDMVIAMKAIPTGPAPPRKGQAGPRRGSDASQCSDRSRVPNPFTAIRNRAIEDCAKVAERYAGRRAISTHAMAQDIAADIRKLASSTPSTRAQDAQTAPPLPGSTDRRDFPWWAFV